MTATEAREKMALVVGELARRTSAKVCSFFPSSGPVRRDLYRRHLEFFRLGRTMFERLFMAGNRVGKSEAGAFEARCHLTGLYPSWWEGRRFTAPTDGWACGTNAETTRDIVQEKLVGKLRGETFEGGMVEPWLIVRHVKKQGRPGAVESVTIRHASGGESVVTFKSYEQGRSSFEGQSKDFVWCDEEPPLDCYIEMLYRLLTTKGLMFVTFTPLQGMSEVVSRFVEQTDPALEHVMAVVQAGWDDVPHLDDATKAALLAATPPYQRAARTKGEPMLGAGAIYQIAESELLVPTRDVPETWLRGYGMDIGWNRTAVVWGALNPASDVLELYDCHYMAQGEPPSHAMAVKARGADLVGVIDPAAMGTTLDGKTGMQMYADLGLHLQPAVNAVESGLMAVWTRMITGRLKVQAHLEPWFQEFRKYHRDEGGKIVKANDHLMDATRYLVVSGRPYMRLLERKRRTASGGASRWAWT